MNFKRFIMIASITTIFTGFFSLIFSKSTLAAKSGEVSNSSIYEMKLKLNNGDLISLSKFKGKKLMFVNVASRCGFTSQYKKLQQLYEKKNDVLEIIAIPCNDFGRQEPGSAEDIKRFCESNYKVTFTIADKQNIKSRTRSELYNWLSDPALNGWNDQLPSWNFCKYLIDENGELTHFFKSNVDPVGEKIFPLI